MTEEFFRQILSRKQTETRNIATQTDNPQVYISDTTLTSTDTLSSNTDTSPSSTSDTTSPNSDTTPIRPTVKRRLKRKLSTTTTTTKKSVIYGARKEDQEKKQSKALRERRRVRNEANAFKILRSNLPPVAVDKQTGAPIYAKTYCEIMCTAVDYIKGLTEMLEEHDGKNQIV